MTHAPYHDHNDGLIPAIVRSNNFTATISVTQGESIQTALKHSLLDDEVEINMPKQQWMGSSSTEQSLLILQAYFNIRVHIFRRIQVDNSWKLEECCLHPSK